MSNRYRSAFEINARNLHCYRNNHYHFRLHREKYQIIQGTVYNQNQQPCVGAAIQVVAIDCRNGYTRLLGYVVTNELGEYVFSVSAKPYLKYELTVFAPLI